MLPTEDALWSAKNSPSVSASVLAIRPPPPTPTVSPSASLAKSPSAPKFWSSTTAITAPSTKPTSRSTPTAPHPAPRQYRPARKSECHYPHRRIQRPRRPRKGSGPSRRRLHSRRAGLTNVGIVHPDAGFWPSRAARQEFGTLLIIDETHTICTGPGGYTAPTDLHPDIFVIGKAVAGGIPAATYGCTAAVAEKITTAFIWKIATPAASAAPWPATRSRSRRCAPLSKMSSRPKPSPT